MKLNIIELRDMVAEAVRQTVREAKKKPKLSAPRSEESIAAQRERQLTALPGYAHGNVLDMSKPLGKRNRLKRQGHSNIGNWTSEARSRIREDDHDNPGGGAGSGDGDHGDIVRSVPHQTGDERQPSSLIMKVLLGNGIPSEKAERIARQLSDISNGPLELGIEAKHEAVRRLIRLVVNEEIRVAARAR